MKGLSIAQVIILLGIAAALVGVGLTALKGQWHLTALLAAVSFGFFVILVSVTLAAMLRTIRLIRGRVRTIDREIRQNRHIAAGVRRIDNRTADRFKMMEATEARLEAAERRLLATFEAHRFQLEDELAELKETRSPQQ